MLLHSIIDPGGNMNIQNSMKEIRSFNEANANPALVQKYARYFVEGYDAFGVDGKAAEVQRKQWFTDWSREHDLDWFLDLGDQLVKTGKYEEGWTAMSFIILQVKSIKPETFTRVGAWLDEGGLRNWAHVDTFSSELLSQFLVNQVVPLSAFADWRNSPTKWKRRAVPVTLIKALKLDCQTDELLVFIDPMMGDTEKVVHQGLGWFLREAWKRDRGPVEVFLLKWKDTCARLIIQYATEKMSREEKLRYRKVKSVKTA
jgi:3-methyladenine DNA glycosylase AlkD